jgi:uncharacterized phiE125 gp8 family phage protein
MALFRTVEPAVEPVNLAEAKAWLRINHASEDAQILELISAARHDVEHQSGQSLINQEWRMTLDNWPTKAMIDLPKGPITSVISVVTYNASGLPATMPAANYLLDFRSQPARLSFDTRPAIGRAMNGLEIDYAAGYGATGTDVPDILKRAILMLVAHWYEFRGAYRASDQPVSYPDGYLPLIRPYRRVLL